MRVLITGASRAIGKASAEELTNRGHEVDAVVNNAAVTASGPLEEFPIDELQRIFDTNVLGPVRIVHSVAPAWRARGSGELPEYAELWAQWEGNDDKLTGPAGRPGPELVAVAIADAIDKEDTPLRVPVGADAELVLATRKELEDDAFEAAMRAALHLDW